MIVKTSRAQTLKAVGLMFHTAWHHLLSHLHFESHTRGGMTGDGKEHMRHVEKWHGELHLLLRAPCVLLCKMP